jgi:predicted Zn-ribbon and HTH transcriptional regulator
MKRRQEAHRKSSTTIVTAHNEEIVCASCGFDLDENELSASKCSDCGQPLELKKSISIEATSIPAFGDS